MHDLACGTRICCGPTSLTELHAATENAYAGRPQDLSQATPHGERLHVTRLGDGQPSTEIPPHNRKAGAYCAMFEVGHYQ